MTILKLNLSLLLLFISSHFSNNETDKIAVENLSYAKNLIGSFIDEMNAYSEDYDWGRRLYIVDDILDGPETNVAWDIPGTDFNEPALVVRTYLRRIKELNVKINYSDFELTNCQTQQYGYLLGAIVDKTISLPNGKSYQFKEFIELSGSSANIRIRSITSNKYQSLSGFKCLQASKKPVKELEEGKCLLFDEAEAAYNSGKFSEALNLYRKSKSCAKNLQYVDNRIAELNTLDRRKSILTEADYAYNRGNFNKAISLYQNYLDSNPGTDSYSNRQEVLNKIDNAKSEIAFQELTEEAEYYMSKRYYEQALIAYRQALRIKPGNQGVLNQIRQAERNQRSEQTILIRQQITQATSLLNNPRQQGDALVTLMKYEDSGLLNARHFYNMSFILEQNNRAAKKEFNLSRKDICVLARRYAIKASNLGLSEKEYNYIWKDHFNKKSRTCE